MNEKMAKKMEAFRAKRRLKWIEHHVRRKVNEADKKGYGLEQAALEAFMWRRTCEKLMAIVDNSKAEA